MRRAEIVEAAKRLSGAISSSNVSSTLHRFLGATPEKKSLGPLLRTITGLTARSSEFGDTEWRLADILGIKPVFEPEFWDQITGSPPEGGRKDGMRVYRRISLTTDYLEAIVDLLRTDVADLGKLSGERAEAVLSVIVVEEHGQISRPARLIALLESIDSLYEAATVLVGESGRPISVIACDSGSDKSFDFLGAAKVVEMVKSVLLDLWDRVVFYRERQFAVRLELVADSLPVLEKIADLERAGTLVPEQAEIVRRKILAGSTKFLESGAVLPEFDERAHTSPRLLMAPEPRLLTAGPSTEKPAETSSDLESPRLRAKRAINLTNDVGENE